jgi:fructokinase
MVSVLPHPAVSMSVASDPAITRVLILGEALIDHFPETQVVGGAPFNVARNLAALGALPLFITRVGEDADAATLLSEFTRWSMPISGVQRDALRLTGNVQVTFLDGQPQYFIAPNQAWDAINLAHAQESLGMFKPSIVCFGTLAQRDAISRAAIRGVVEAARCLRVLDLNLRQCDDNEAISAWSLAHADIVKVNDDELEQLLAWFVSRQSKDVVWGSATHRQDIRVLMGRFGFSRLIVTRGAKGYAAFDAQGAVLAIGEAPVVSVIDTVGAGDAFFAVCLLGEIFGWNFAESLSRASEFAASVCTLRGAVSVEKNFYQLWRERFGLAAVIASPPIIDTTVTH